MKKTLPLRLAAIGCVCTIAMKAGALEVTPSVRMHLDYAVQDAGKAQPGDHFLIRRASIGFDGTINRDWSFEAVYDYADGGNSKDVYLRYAGWKPGVITIGQFKVPFGLDVLASSNDIVFIERALPGATFAPSRRVGVGFATSGAKHTFTAMGFGPSIGGDEGHGAAARFTFTPVNRGNVLVHLGLAATTTQPIGEASFSARLESRPTNVRLVSTGTLRDVSRINYLGLEVSWRTGPLSIQSEWMRSDLSGSAGRHDLSFHGGYVAASWTLTGEVRGYRDGVFRGISPGKSSGAWELTARYSYISLDDGPVLGGRADHFLLGLNWYANDNVRVMANYMNVNSDRLDVSDVSNILLVRAQIAF